MNDLHLKRKTLRKQKWSQNDVTFSKLLEPKPTGYPEKQQSDSVDVSDHDAFVLLSVSVMKLGTLKAVESSNIAHSLSSGSRIQSGAGPSSAGKPNLL